MSFAQENGYIPRTVEEMIDTIRVAINAQFNTTYTEGGFVGSSWYKFVYAVVQEWQKGEVTTSEVFSKLQQYISLTNDRIQRPSTTAPGMAEAFLEEEYLIRIKPPTIGDAGTISVCVDLDNTDDDYAEDKLAVCELLSQYVAGGIITQGTETEAIVLSNGQSFDFKFYLPTRIPAIFRATVIESENNQLAVDPDETVRQKIFDNINARYKLGLNFEPDKYLNSVDVPWAGSILLEWSINDGATWFATIYDADFKDVFTYDLEDITVLYE